MIAGPFNTHTHKHSQTMHVHADTYMHKVLTHIYTLVQWLKRNSLVHCTEQWRVLFVWLLSVVKSWFPAVAPTDFKSSPDLFVSPERWDLVNTSLTKRFFDCSQAILCQLTNKMCSNHNLVKQCFCLFSSYWLYLFSLGFWLIWSHTKCWWGVSQTN